MKTEDIMRYEAFFEKNPEILAIEDIDEYMAVMNKLGEDHPLETPLRVNRERKKSGRVKYKGPPYLPSPS